MRKILYFAALLVGVAAMAGAASATAPPWYGHINGAGKVVCDRGNNGQFGPFETKDACEAYGNSLDVCPNIADIQTTIPDGDVLNSDGQCVPKPHGGDGGGGGDNCDSDHHGDHHDGGYNDRKDGGDDCTPPPPPRTSAPVVLPPPPAKEDVCTDVNYTRGDGTMGQFFELLNKQWIAWQAGTPYLDFKGVTVKSMQPANFLQGKGNSCDRTDGYVFSGQLTTETGLLFASASGPLAKYLLASGGWYPYWLKA